MPTESKRQEALRNVYGRPLLIFFILLEIVGRLVEAKWHELIRTVPDVTVPLAAAKWCTDMSALWQVLPVWCSDAAWLHNLAL